MSLSTARLSVLLFLSSFSAALLAQPMTPINVFVSVLPQKQMVERIGGAHVRVFALVAAGKDPHTYEPTPAQIAELNRSQLLLVIGMPFEKAWLPKLKQTAAKTKIVDMRDGMVLRTLEPQLKLVGEHSSTKAESDPHLWTNPVMLKAMAARVRDELTRALPAEKKEFQGNFERYRVELEALDQDIRATLARSKVRRFMVFHPAWGYFADQYGLKQIAIEYEGKEPGAKSLARIIDIARSEKINVIFVQPQLSPRAAENVAQSVGAQVKPLDDLAEDVISNLRNAARILAAAQEKK